MQQVTLDVDLVAAYNVAVHDIILFYCFHYIIYSITTFSTIDTTITSYWYGYYYGFILSLQQVLPLLLLQPPFLPSLPSLFEAS